MSCSLTYDSQLSRVRVDADTLCVSGTAAYATVERSPDGSSYSIVRGGDDVVLVTGCAFGVPVDDYEFPLSNELTYRVRGYSESDVLTAEYTCTITVTQEQLWLKSVERPFLNRGFNCIGNPSPIRRRARQGVFDIMGRTMPVATTDIRSGIEVTLRVITSTATSHVDLDYLLASGDILYVQPTTNYPVTAMFAVVDDQIPVGRPITRRDCDFDMRVFDINLVQVAAPNDDVVGTTVTWQTIVNTYATWADLVADHATWADVLEIIVDPSEVIVT